ncbi:MAG: type 2 isopentenyl-diphosphate Delta-isomerase [Trueperaceae bacterium]|nr:type 2 isopentenyl-diphosphate Delta-isomerase [Trueperaceae bacterium]
MDTLELATRKLKHLDVCLNYPVNYQTRTTGFEFYDLPYQALPETDLAKLDSRCTFLSKPLSAPILIGAMTGGAEKAKLINKNLALAAEQLGLGLMLGSQRVMLEHPEASESFAVRAYAPSCLLIGNLGVAQLNRGYGSREIIRAIETIGADALALHTNPLQEALQEAGDEDFSGLLAKLETIIKEVPYPLLLKEVGQGLSKEVVNQVKDFGFAALDIAGAGGTSWARVEEFVRYGEIRHAELTDWGIPTAKALVDAKQVTPAHTLIASGGIRTGLDIAKALALGADVVAIARPLLAPALDSAEAVIEKLQDLIDELKIAMHCTGAKDIAALKTLELSKR